LVAVALYCLLFGYWQSITEEYGQLRSQLATTFVVVLSIAAARWEAEAGTKCTHPYGVETLFESKWSLLGGRRTGFSFDTNPENEKLTKEMSLFRNCIMIRHSFHALRAFHPYNFLSAIVYRK
jgi:hypothetical protein